MQQQPSYASTPNAPGAGGVPPAYATTGGSASGASPRDYVPTTPEERAYYDALFQVADTQGTGQLQGLQAVTFFKASGLDVYVLKHVWAIADARNQHFLDREAFYVAMRLIALAQAGQPALTRERLRETLGLAMPYPRFQGVPVQPPPPVPTRSLAPPSPSSSSSGSASDPYGMTAEERARYLVHFGPCDLNGDGFVEGAQAVDLFSRSGLERAVLGRVWELADADRDNRLSAAEFAVAMHLIVCASKRGLPLPPTLPPSLRQTLALPPPSAVVATSPQAPSPGRSVPAMPSPQQLQPRPLSASSSSAAASPVPTPLPVPAVPPSPGLLGKTMPAPAPVPAMPPSLGATSSSVASLGASSASVRGMGAAQDVGGSSSSSSSNEAAALGQVGEIAQRMKAERVALSATVEAAGAENKRLQEGLAKALQEVAALQAELASLRKAASAADEEGRQALESLGAARKHRELLLQEVEKARAEVERLGQQKANLAEELAGLQLEAKASKAGAEGLEALAAEHRAEAATNRREVELIQSILQAQEAAKARLESEVSALEAQVSRAKGGLEQEQAALGGKRAELAAAREERDATTQERHAALLKLAGMGSSGNGGTSSSSAPVAVAAASSAPTAAAKPTAFGFEEEGDKGVSRGSSELAGGPEPATSSSLPKAASFGDDSFTKAVVMAAAPVPTNGAADDFEFPAPEEGSAMPADDAFPAPVVETPPTTNKAAAPATAAVASKDDPFATDPFGFPDDDFATAPMPAAASGGATAAPAKGGSAGSGGGGAFASDGFEDDFSASAFDKF